MSFWYTGVGPDAPTPAVSPQQSVANKYFLNLRNLTDDDEREFLFIGRQALGDINLRF